MRKILLAYEDFNELTITESYLKKVGFDVLGISNELFINEKILSFNPDIVLVHGKASRVSSLSVGQKLKEHSRFNGKVVIVLPKGFKPTPSDMIKIKMDAALEAPVQPEKLIETLAKVAGLDAKPLLEKFSRARMSDPEIEAWFKVSGKNFVKPERNLIQDPTRIEKYSKHLNIEAVDSHKTSFVRGKVRERQKELKKDWDFEALEEIDRLKRQFAEALFKKK